LALRLFCLVVIQTIALKLLAAGETPNL